MRGNSLAIGNILPVWAVGYQHRDGVRVGVVRAVDVAPDQAGASGQAGHGDGYILGKDIGEGGAVVGCDVGEGAVIAVLGGRSGLGFGAGVVVWLGGGKGHDAQYLCLWCSQ